MAGSWKKLGGRLKRVATGAPGVVWGIDATNSIVKHQWDGSRMAWAPQPKLPPSSGDSAPIALDVDVGNDGTVIAISNAGNAYRFIHDQNRWHPFNSLPPLKILTEGFRDRCRQQFAHLGHSYV